jgi:hypothetical protein
VQDVHCAVASARRVADWLVDNKDSLTPPLASIDLLLSEAPADPKRQPYPMKLQPQQLIQRANSANVDAHGDAWQEQFQAGDTAFFFISGHGAMEDNDAVVFLDDLNSKQKDPWGAFLNVSKTARALKGDQRLTAAFLFSDACQEYSRRFSEVDHGDGVRILTPQDPTRLPQARDKVAFVTAASQGLETLEGDWDVDSKVKMGRFTQVLIQALDGASSRQQDEDWVVYAEGAAGDLKSLYRLRSWTDAFEPSFVYVQNERYPIIRHVQPKVPVIVQTRPPDRIPDCSLEIFLPADRTEPAIQHCGPGPRKFWEVWLAACDKPHLVVATHANTSAVACAQVTPNQPYFVKTVPFP